ncbi:DUF6507 family protein [Streptomyces sp. TRM76130]|nr:DUF6507 family protein [Streptomyces sp. TRM76130]
MTSLVVDAMDDMAKDVKAYGTDVQSAATHAGTIVGGGFYCGAGPQAGPVGEALALFVDRTAEEVLALGARAAKSVNGAREATAYYVVGDQEMAARTQRQALAAPEIELPTRDGGDVQE